MILQTNSYLITIFITSTACASFFVDFAVMKFNVRFFMFVYFDGLAGIFNPLLSSLKSQMIPEKLRTTIMNFFRIPINIFSILTLTLTNYITTYQVKQINFYSLFILKKIDLPCCIFLHVTSNYGQRLFTLYT
jgi:hypothetical protein